MSRTLKESPPALRPRLAAHVTVHPPHEPGQSWVIEQRGSRYFRVGADVAVLAQLLTGDYDREELLALLDERWNRKTLDAALERFAGMRLLDDGSPPHSSSRKITLVLPLTIQFTVFNPTGLLNSLLPLIRFLSLRPSLILLAALSLGGLAVMVAQADAVIRAISQPLPGIVLAWMLLGVFISTAIHELSHGAVLVRYGGRPRRLGIMLFYLVPAFFCDVSDGWLLPHRAQRVRIALAGIAAQAVCAGIAAFSAFFASGVVEVTLLLTAASLYFACLINLVPFVKLDGYLALMSALDVSELRSQAIADARGFFGRILFAGRPSRCLPDRWWVILYGIMCIFFPVYLIGGVAFAMWTRAAANTGGATAVLTLCFLLVLLVYIGRELLKVLTTALAAGARTLRVAFVSGFLAVIAALGLSLITVEGSVEGSYFTEGDTTYFALADNGTASLIEEGQRVELRSNGVILRPEVGQAVIADGETETKSLSATAFMPYDLPLNLREDYHTHRLILTDPPDAETGSAQVSIGESSLGEWLFNRFVRPVI